MFAKEEEGGFLVVSKPPLETEVHSPSGLWVLYFPMVFDKIATAKGGRIVGVVGKTDFVILEVRGL